MPQTVPGVVTRAQPRPHLLLLAAVALSTACASSDSAADSAVVDVLTGTLGDLGAVQPIVAGQVIEYSGETITYLSTVDLACSDMAESRWLGNLDPDAQIVEIVYKSDTTSTELEVGGTGSLEVNYAKGGRSSAYEESAVSGTVSLTSHTAGGPIAGYVNATYSDPSGEVYGPFQADFCEGGQQY